MEVRGEGDTRSRRGTGLVFSEALRFSVFAFQSAPSLNPFFLAQQLVRLPAALGCREMEVVMVGEGPMSHRKGPGHILPL